MELAIAQKSVCQKVEPKDILALEVMEHAVLVREIFQLDSGWGTLKHF